MKYLISKFRSISLKSKLIISFIGLIVFPLFVLNYFSTTLYSQEIHKTVVRSAVQSNEQVIKNLDTFLEMMQKLSEYPLKDKTLRININKDYSAFPFRDFERSRDFDSAKELLFSNIWTYSDMIDSILLYKARTFEIRGRIPTDSINDEYKISQEKWIDKIEKLEGGCAIVGIHRDKQQSVVGNYVITVGRSIIDPESKEKIGIIVINIGIDKLEKLWMDFDSTSNSKFYLIDENNNIIFCKDKNQINKNADEIFERKMNFGESDNNLYNLKGEEYYTITSVSKVSKWKVVTVIPRKELFSYIDKMFSIIILTISIIIFLSILVAIFIATGVTKPLYKLNSKMRQVAKGNFNVEIDISDGEVGEIDRTVQKMIKEIKMLINKIYKEEEEKRIAEMNALQSQINPHFLYNTLNTISWMANIQGATSIENAIRSLSSLFSFTAKSIGDFVPIKDEVIFIQDYLKILNLRYYNKFAVEFDIDEKIYEYKTLKFLLQPVIENAIFHGIEASDRKGLLKISIKQEADSIIFKVEDNGKGINESILKTVFKEETEIKRNRFNSIGIPNIQKRIKLHFGEEYGLTIDSVDNKGTTVTIIIPAIPLED